jgi:hypothetical protein
VSRSVGRVVAALAGGVLATLLLVWLADVQGWWRLLAGCLVAYLGLCWLVADAEQDDDWVRCVPPPCDEPKQVHVEYYLYVDDPEGEP